MPAYIKNTIRNENYMKKLISKMMDESIKVMAKDINKMSKELEPPQPVKDSFADRLRQIIGNKW